MAPDTTADALTTDPDFNPKAGTYHVEFDWRTDPPASRLAVCAVAAISETPVDALDSIEKKVDTTALDRLCSPADAETARPSGKMTFVFERHRVTVYRYGSIVIRPPKSESLAVRVDDS